MSHSQFADLFALTETVEFRGTKITLTIRPHEVGDLTLMTAAEKKGKPGPIKDAYKTYLRAKVVSAHVTTEDGNSKTIDPQDLAATMGRRVRLGHKIAKQLGWDPLTVNAWVVVADSRTNHRRVLQHAGILRKAFPSDGHAIRSWLMRPSERISALSF